MDRTSRLGAYVGQQQARGALIQKENFGAVHRHTPHLSYLHPDLFACWLFRTLHAQSGGDVWYWHFLICITSCVSATISPCLYSVCVALKKKRSNINKIKKEETAHFRFHLFNWARRYYSPFPFLLKRPVFMMKEWKRLSASEVGGGFEAYLYFIYLFFLKDEKKKKQQKIALTSPYSNCQCVRTAECVVCRGCANYYYSFISLFF